MEAEYHDSPQRNTTEFTRSETARPSAFLRRQIEALKAAVRIEDLAEEYGGFRRVSTDRIEGRCVSLSHTDRTPSMSVYTVGQRFKCYGCGEYGDVIDMVMLAEGIPKGDVRAGVEELARRYHVELPKRPPTWFAKYARQKPIREKMEEVRVEAAKRRLWRFVFEPMVRCVEDPDAREDLGDYVWDELLPLAVRMADANRGDGRG